MKTNNKMNNQGRNNNHRNVTFVEDLGSIIRRNSTIPQSISGELRITNGDVEGAVAVYCSNAAYRNQTETRDELKLLKAESEAKDISKEAIAESETSKEAVVVPETTQQNEIEKAKSELAKLRAEYEDAPFSKKPENYYSHVAQLSRSINDAEAEDLLVNILTGLQLIKAFESFIYSIRKNVTIINERDAEEVRLDYALMRFGISEAKAAEVFSRIHDCLGFDVFTIKAKNNHVYITCGNVDGVLETFCSTSKETSMQFITRMMEANKP